MQLIGICRCTLALALIPLLGACGGEPEVYIGNNQFCTVGTDLEQAYHQCRVPLPAEFADGDLYLFTSDLSMTVEQLLELTLVTPAAVQPIMSDIVGVSMYMGRIPVVWEQRDADEELATSATWQAQLLLGACSDPNMVWNLRLNVENIAGDRHTLIIPFQSSW
ncbi:hypothetical protein CWE06_02105 [Aliidiomarina haloalkalitolerans]|uniref:Uncharacterized protein n=1 Tax=Aliidiomarina haloalkalitolerans TaxID=859059 RepID=A0A432VYG1_9GAMM|nr:hypothetical protein CWE06_02105 [Aliidiomarina haloalkalitolerans]